MPRARQLSYSLNETAERRTARADVLVSRPTYSNRTNFYEKKIYVYGGSIVDVVRKKKIENFFSSLRHIAR